MWLTFLKLRNFEKKQNCYLCNELSNEATFGANYIHRSANIEIVAYVYPRYKYIRVFMGMQICIYNRRYTKIHI